MEAVGRFLNVYPQLFLLHRELDLRPRNTKYHGGIWQQ